MSYKNSVFRVRVCQKKDREQWMSIVTTIENIGEDNQRKLITERYWIDLI